MSHDTFDAFAEAQAILSFVIEVLDQEIHLSDEACFGLAAVLKVCRERLSQIAGASTPP